MTSAIVLAVLQVALCRISLFLVGRVGQEEKITNPDFEFHDDWHPEDTDNKSDWERNQFLDLDRPLIMQVWNADFSKAFYLQQVHQPRCARARLLFPRHRELPLTD